MGSPYADYLDYLNRWLRRYQLSPLRQMKETDWKGMSHASGAGYELAYVRGAAVAVWADAAIRARSNGRSSLDNVMFDLVKQAESAQPSPDFNEERVIAAFAPYLSAEEMTQLRRMVIDGADVPLPERLGVCAELQKKTQPVVDPGFDEQKSVAQKQVTGVVQDGPAYRAGIRDGQELFRWSIDNDDPSKDALLGVMIDGQKKLITFSPAKQREIEQYSGTVEVDAARGCVPF